MSYSFDPVFFEEHVLRAVLRLVSDPVEQPTRFHNEALRELQKTPVVAIIDAGRNQSGRRLPFDLLEVSEVVFHPKTALLLYSEHARLQIGSGNLTFSGYSENSELFLCVELAYDVDADAALLLNFIEHLSRVCGIVRGQGTQLKLIREELQRRLPRSSHSPKPSAIKFLDSTLDSIVDQVITLLPRGADVQSIGMLAPFYERDSSTLDDSSVFATLRTLGGENTILDIGVTWENSKFQITKDISLEEGIGKLWTWSSEENGRRIHTHISPMTIGPKTVSYFNETGKAKRWCLQEIYQAIEQRALWIQPKPITIAPRNAVRAAAEIFSKVRIWLHPADRLHDGQPIHRPLHAKLLVVTFVDGESEGTLVVMGSPNMSRRALLKKAGSGRGNVEYAVAFVLDSCRTLRDFVPELVFAPVSALELKEPKFPEPTRNYSLAIQQVIHDPREHTLVVTWSSESADLPAWHLTYDRQRLGGSETPPFMPLRVVNFVLKPTTAEVSLHIYGREYRVPILVSDLAALPASPDGRALDLIELLMLLGRRIGTERAVQIIERTPVGADADCDSSLFFGDGFGPADVFRAWWSVAEDLQNSSLSVPAFRLRIEGALGVGAAWNCMLKAINQNTLQNMEVWFYGAELLRTLDAIELPCAVDQGAKTKMLTEFRTRVQCDLRGLVSATDSQPWVKRIVDFYKESWL